MPSVNLVRRWGSHDPGQTVEVDDTMADWLVGNCFAEREDAPGTASAGARAPGEAGADPRAGGDLSRGGGMRSRKGPRDDGKPNPETGEANYANRAAAVKGSPRPGGPNSPDADPEYHQKQADQKRQAEEGASSASGESQPGGAQPGVVGKPVGSQQGQK
jgi:hypothetical protein